MNNKNHGKLTIFLSIVGLFFSIIIIGIVPCIIALFLIVLDAKRGNGVKSEKISAIISIVGIAISCLLINAVHEDLERQRINQEVIANLELAQQQLDEAKKIIEDYNNSKEKNVEYLGNIEEKEVENNFSTEELEKKTLEENEVAYLEISPQYISDLTLSMNKVGMDINNIYKVEKLDDWNNGERYKIYYGVSEQEEYIIYFYDNSQVASINDFTDSKIYENLNEEENDDADDNVINIVDGQEGEYGQVDNFSGYEVIRYYLPNGKYLVTCQTRGSGFYVESIEEHLEDGFETSEIYEKIFFSSNEEKIEIEIKEGQCISLLINSKLQFKPIQ